MEDCYEIVAENLGKALTSGSKIAIYGTGEAARSICEQLHGMYNIVGLLDRDAGRIGCELYGHRVIPLEQIADTDAVVIAANFPYWDVIFRRIKEFTDENDITVFYANGIEAKLPEHVPAREHDYRERSLLELEKLCSNYDIISFDLFDTLFMRRLADDSGLYLLLEHRITKHLPDLKIKNFSLYREQAERKCNKQNKGIFTIHDIYDEIATQCALSDEQSDAMKQVEICAHAQLLTPRKEVIDLYKQLIRKDKRIILVSDMYLTSSDLEPILKNFGITGYEALFISCEREGTKELGSLWKVVSDYLKNESFLHIGDNYTADIEQPKLVGAETYYLMKASVMLNESSISGLAAAATTVGDCVSLGMLQAKLFNNPFALHDFMGKPFILSPEDFGYCFFGPLVTGFMQWLIERLVEDKPCIVLFTARDGYLFEKIYQQYKIKCTDIELPTGMYLKSSRRACSVPAFFSEDDVLDSLRVAYSGSSDIFFRKRLGIDPPVADFILSTSEPETIQLVRDNMEQILCNAALERERYTVYLQSMFITDIKKVALFDSGQNGTTQYYLNKLISHDILGYYIYYADKTGSFASDLDVQALYTESCDPGFRILSRRSAQCEAVFTAPEGMYLCIDDTGDFVSDICSDNKNGFEVVERIHNGIMQYLGEYEDFRLPAPSKEFAASLPEHFDCVHLCDEVRSSCCFEDSFRSSSVKHPVFE